eukprot:CAMPEP_0205819672 /NCGR_PEP_ID=MMETSP0206-20130828/2130_1 /ASSEMBLY_ACC=CAM_ASM_000279 /TAXON_ID=36767 /ORGANISM="Euplotes focardii, Strain TN1" /LENGTH=142 /DNA_ID=CAMNT_0053113537 /DNA_START=52 /DNA_END=480 /DNA_ORIENTATION=+
MSMAGITMSQEALDAFEKVQGRRSKCRWATFKLAKKADDGVVVGEIHDEKEEFSYKQFADTVEKNAPRFAAVLYEFDAADGSHKEKVVLLSYIPDDAPVKQKMLMGSSIEMFKKSLIGWHKYQQASDLADLEEKAILKLCST